MRHRVRKGRCDGSSSDLSCASSGIRIMLEAEELPRRVFRICTIANLARCRTERRRVVTTCREIANLDCSRTESRRVVITHRRFANRGRSRTESQRIVDTYIWLVNRHRGRTESQRVPITRIGIRSLDRGRSEGRRILITRKSRNASVADALASGCGLVRVQPVVDRIAHVCRVKRGPSRLVPGARGVLVAPPDILIRQALAAPRGN